MTQTYDLATLTAGCESEQLHRSGAIQNYGALLVLTTDGKTITHASANLEAHIGVTADAVLNTQISLTLPWLYATLTLALGRQKPGNNQLCSHITEGCAGWLDAWLTLSGRHLLVELLPSRNTPPLAIHRLQLPLLKAPGDPAEAAAFHDALLLGVREITGFDRVMLYRFHDDFSGEVIAEQVREGLGSYLGLRFPASDIPAIARRIYLVNPWRSIPDISTPISAVLGDDVPDLTNSLLRSVSPVHLKYLEHMGVRASFSLPVKVGGKLWGLVACHHMSPLAPDPEACQVASTLAQAHSLGLGSYLAQSRMQSIDALNRRVEGILNIITAYDSTIDAIAAEPQPLLEIMNADGLVMAIGDDFVAHGHCPDSTGLAELDAWFIKEQECAIMSDTLSSMTAAVASAIRPLAGLMALKTMSRDPKTAGQWVRIYWFRREEPLEVPWAGNPDKPMAENTAIPSLAPRRSFERWIEVKRGVSRPWTNEDRMYCAHFRNALLRCL
jgi:light-regulated signal transduction histidine kinase (bacteriophytochrome)